MYYYVYCEAARRNCTLLRSPIEGCMVNHMVNVSNLVLQHNQDGGISNANANHKKISLQSQQQQQQLQQSINPLNIDYIYPVNDTFNQYLPVNILNNTLQWTKNIACFNGKKWINFRL